MQIDTQTIHIDMEGEQNFDQMAQALESIFGGMRPNPQSLNQPRQPSTLRERRIQPAEASPVEGQQRVPTESEFRKQVKQQFSTRYNKYARMLNKQFAEICHSCFI